MFPNCAIIYYPVYTLPNAKGSSWKWMQSKICFKRNRTTLFTATVTPHHTGIVDASTELNPESAHAASTLPMDINLWHRCCAHHSHATITKLIQGDLVIGLIVSSKSQFDPICEACLAGKMTSGPFRALIAFLSTHLNWFILTFMGLSLLPAAKVEYCRRMMGIYP